VKPCIYLVFSEGISRYELRIAIPFSMRKRRAAPNVVYLVRFEVFTAMTMKKAVFWDVAPCRYCVNRRFGGTYYLHLQGRRKEKKRKFVSDEPG
jgi:hypothetical protein